MVAVAMELFGRCGYHATTVAQIEKAVGLSAGAGGLYRHFPSKRALLEEGLRRQAEASQGLLAYINASDPPVGQPLKDQLLAIARAGLRRLDDERDVNRLLLRDLARFPDLLEQIRQQELRRVFDALVGWLRRHDGTGTGHADWPAVAAVLMAALSHYWIMSDIFSGDHPHGVDSDRFTVALADMAERLLTPPG